MNHPTGSKLSVLAATMFEGILYALLPGAFIIVCLTWGHPDEMAIFIGALLVLGVVAGLMWGGFFLLIEWAEEHDRKIRESNEIAAGPELTYRADLQGSADE